MYIQTYILCCARSAIFLRFQVPVRYKKLFNAQQHSRNLHIFLIVPIRSEFRPAKCQHYCKNCRIKTYAKQRNETSRGFRRSLDKHDIWNRLIELWLYMIGIFALCTHRSSPCVQFQFWPRSGVSGRRGALYVLYEGRCWGFTLCAGCRRWPEGHCSEVAVGC